MSSVLNTPRRRKYPISFIISGCLCMYFSFHLLFGERGYLQMHHLSYDYEVTLLEYEDLKSQREALEKNVVGMRSGSIDVDLLEERVQVMLGVLPKNAIILVR